MPARVTWTRASPSAGSGRGASSTSWSTSGPPHSSIRMARIRTRRLPSGAHMSLTVVGSIAFDAVETPAGKRDRLLGGAAVHFSLASSFLADTRVVGPVGDDFGEDEYAVLHARGVNTDDVEHVAGGRTFFWAGRYERDPNVRHTLQTDLNVFEHFEPKLSDASRAAETVFLANTHPDLQRPVHEPCPGARFVAMDTMNMWIEVTRESLEQTIAAVDCLIVNDEEVKQLT